MDFPQLQLYCDNKVDFAIVKVNYVTFTILLYILKETFVECGFLLLENLTFCKYEKSNRVILCFRSKSFILLFIRFSEIVNYKK